MKTKILSNPQPAEVTFTPGLAYIRHDGAVVQFRRDALTFSATFEGITLVSTPEAGAFGTEKIWMKNQFKPFLGRIELSFEPDQFKEPVRKKHNPAGIIWCEDDLSDGERPWRLLDEDEISPKGGSSVDGLYFYHQGLAMWMGYAVGDCKENTYRTKLTREELRRARRL